MSERDLTSFGMKFLAEARDFVDARAWPKLPVRFSSDLFYAYDLRKISDADWCDAVEHELRFAQPAKPGPRPWKRRFADACRRGVARLRSLAARAAG
jgi:hypothetical protein